MTETNQPRALTDQVRRVAQLRAANDMLAADLAERRAAFEEENAHLLGQVRKMKGLLTEEELRLRDMTVAEFRATGKKKPAPGVSVRQTVDLVYDEAKAFQWAEDKRLCLQLDVKAFNALALHQDLPFVQRLLTASGAIATDLSFALEPEPAEPEPPAAEPVTPPAPEPVEVDEEGAPF